jgi:prepilin-type N-terminal cleavage/methylation domain-containing protein
LPIAPRAARPARAPRAFTLIELLVVIAIIALLIGILIPAVAGVRSRARSVKDQTQLRAIAQGLSVWAGNHDSEYPLPSEVDKADATISVGTDYQKDNTGNILSLMLFQGIVLPEQLVSPAEVNPAIEVDAGFEFETPSGAADPSRAVFDPGFAGVPFEQGSGMGAGGRRGGANAKGGTSYAHVLPFGPRQGAWGPMDAAAEPVFSSRGPEYQGVVGSWQLRPGPTGEASNTLRIFGAGGRWRGNVAFNDGRVMHATRPDPDQIRFAFDNMPDARDNIFVNENDQNGALSFEQNPGQNANVLLRAYSDVQASGPRRSDARVTTFID